MEPELLLPDSGAEKTHSPERHNTSHSCILRKELWWPGAPFTPSLSVPQVFPDAKTVPKIKDKLNDENQVEDQIFDYLDEAHYFPPFWPFD
ncbi:hypothetical protein P7K49_023488 [Saguinus oedipus]|uniref:Uncharacterized protein n=1 Tax=Saguinus oedipus TaxID=9490 RepID=A0ABQ9ULR6_SAGOE|nr:hypothetical protein P7K49_023488 [Saguinus oedipus]